jgi:creatinine amidohydrolase
MGIRRIGLWSWHGGNFAFVGELAASYAGEAAVAGYSDLQRFLEVMIAAGTEAGLAVAETDVHAGGLETSLMLAYHPGLVRPFEGVEGYTAAESGWLERLFREGVRPLSPTGVLGSLAGANAQAGERVCAACADELAAFFARELVTAS